MNNTFSPGAAAVTVQSARPRNPYEAWLDVTPLAAPDEGLYTAMREAVPIIDAALDKIVRLTGGFTVECGNASMQPALDRFIRNVRVGSSMCGLHQFAGAYLDSLITYGNAVGEMVLTADGSDIAALYNARLSDVHIRQGAHPLETEICVPDHGALRPVRYPELILFTALNPPAGEVRGVSLLRSLPFVTSVLLKIWSSTGTNFDRIANLRYAVTYKPGTSGTDRAQAKDIAERMAREWADAMQCQKNGVVKDFVAVGDVDIKVIGADNQMIETEIPVRQMLEQIVAKLGIPPFMLGLHWSSTERMSVQQADILTSELESYRRLLDNVIVRILSTWLRLHGSSASVTVHWEGINLQDVVEEANARYTRAQAALLEQQYQQQEGEQHDALPKE